MADSIASFQTLAGLVLRSIIPFAILRATGEAMTPPAPAELAMMITILSFV